MKINGIEIVSSGPEGHVFPRNSIKSMREALKAWANKPRQKAETEAISRKLGRFDKKGGAK